MFLLGNAEMTELFKCKKPGTQCCAPKTKIQEVELRKNDTVVQPLVGFNSYPATPASPTLQFTSFSYENQQTTTTPVVYSKYVCGVKGAKRTNARSYIDEENVSETHDDNATLPQPRNSRKIGDLEDASLYLNKKSTERLVLGSNLVPIPIVYHDLNDTLADDLRHDSWNLSGHENKTFSNRQARVVGGEDGDNGEWCWQVALINSLNQYLCGAALIGKFKSQKVMLFNFLNLFFFSRNSMGTKACIIIMKNY